jgi:hypothetical protein
MVRNRASVHGTRAQTPDDLTAEEAATSGGVRTAARPRDTHDG